MSYDVTVVYRGPPVHDEEIMRLLGKRVVDGSGYWFPLKLRDMEFSFTTQRARQLAVARLNRAHLPYIEKVSVL